MDSPPYAFFVALFKRVAEEETRSRPYARAAAVLGAVNRRWRQMMMFMLSRMPAERAPEDYTRDLALGRNPMAWAALRSRANWAVHNTVCEYENRLWTLSGIFSFDIWPMTSKRRARYEDRLRKKRECLRENAKVVERFHNEVHASLHNEEVRLYTRVQVLRDWFATRPVELLH